MKNKGFTLVEIMIVLAIICIMGAIVFGAIQSNNSNNQFKNDVKQITYQSDDNIKTIDVQIPTKIGSNLYFITSNYNLGDHINFMENFQRILEINNALKEFLKTDDYKIKNLVFTNNGVYIVLE